MEIHQLRNATAIVSVGAHRLLIDPMLSSRGAMPGFKIAGGGRRRNPLVDLPARTEEALASVTDVVLTHEHPDHFDPAGLAWVRSARRPVWASRADAASLAKKGLDVRLLEDGALGMRVEVVRSRHGRGLLGWLLGPVCGYFLAHPAEPSLYVVGDSVLTDSVLDAVDRLRPDVILAPAGAANMGVGGDILFSMDELVTLAKRATGRLVFNHLEALDHCPTTRGALRERMRAEGVGDRVSVPEDGERVRFAWAGARDDDGATMAVRPSEAPASRLQKWVTRPFSGT
jgi:L-ascorbate metabolism protein UlaG (beta-lactamase superfamily)